MAEKANHVKLKFDDKNAVVVQDGKPVYVSDDGKDVVFDYAATLGTITRLNGEAKSHRERAEAAETKVKLFDGIEDPVKAREALEKIKDVDFSKMVHAGKVDEIKAEAQKAFEQKLAAVEERYKPVVTERDGLKSALHNEIVGGSFARSKFIADKLAVPADIVQAKFGAAFKVEEGNRLVAKGPDGNNIFSRARPGELATFDEALEVLVDTYLHRDSILKGTGASGGGANPSGGGGGKRTMTRAAFEALPPAERMAAVKTSTIVD